jgi:hypothetical protein
VYGIGLARQITDAAHNLSPHSLLRSVPSQRSFSATNYLHCKLQNRLSLLSTDKVTFIYMNSRMLKRLKTVKDNPAELMVVKNWETVDIARLIKIENASHCCGWLGLGRDRYGK